MLINKWRDAMLVFEADLGGSGGSEDGDDKGGDNASGDESPEAIKAELDRTRLALKAANKEAAERRKKLDDIEAAEAARKQSELTEVEKLKAEADKAKADLTALQESSRKERIQAAVLQAATTAQFADPVDAIALADLSGVMLEDGKVTGAKEAVEALAKAKPHLVVAQKVAPNINSTAGDGGGKQTNRTVVERALSKAYRRGDK
jgi:hypothetical protein